MANHTYEILLALGVLSPFVGFWLLVFFGPKLGKPTAGWIAVLLGMGVPMLLAGYVLFNWWYVEIPDARQLLTENAFRYHWAWLGSVPVTIGIKLDSLTIAMYAMVTFIAFWIFVFSIGYMSGHSDEVAGQRKYWRFFAYLSLFGFSMLGLLVSSSLLFLFIFWELVGLCSYLLIGFYFHERVPQYAQMKAFITNRVGDFGFIIGMMLVFLYLGTLDLDQAAIVFAQQAASHTGIFASQFTFLGASLATLMGIGLFCGAMGKSAQFPLHVWLPDAMAGPTPVSALIHAATMVAAGVYLVARVFMLMTPGALMFVATIGCLTLTLMALVAMVQTDIKKCLAYSTLSQLGYMIFGLGCGAWIAALFHLITHAFFKSMLFLGSGQVIEGCHHVQDMRKMGGLHKKMPVTCWTFFIGVLAISGAGLPGLHIGLGGYFSKDEILAVAYTRSYEWDQVDKHLPSAHGHGGEHGEAEHVGDEHAAVEEPSSVRLASSAFSDDPSVRLTSDSTHTTHDQADAHGGEHEVVPGDLRAMFDNIPALPKWMFWLAIITAYVTPFYMMRCWWMTFMGKPRDEHVYEHAHESPMMFVPLAVLATGTVVASYYLFRDLIADAAPAATAAPLVWAIDGTQHTVAIEAAHHWLIGGVGFAFVVGFALAIAIYRRGLGIASKIKKVAGPVHTLLDRKYFIDELYNLIWVKGCLLVATISRFFDTWVIDMFYNILGGVTERLAAFSGMVIDKHGVDGVYNGIADFSMDLAQGIRQPQNGKIRNYVLFAVTAATAVVVGLLIWGPELSWVTVASATPINP